MGRKKVKLEWTANDAARKASFRKRKNGLMKKVMELATLCGISATTIIYNQNNNEPAVWPSPIVAHELLIKYVAASESEQEKKKVTLESYLRERTKKMEAEIKRHQKTNMEMDLDHLMHQFHSLRLRGMNEFENVELYRWAWLLEEKIKDIRKRSQYFRQHVSPFSLASALGASGSGPSSHAPPTSLVPPPPFRTGAGGHIRDPSGYPWVQWFTQNVVNGEFNFVGAKGENRSLDLEQHPCSFDNEEEDSSSSSTSSE